MRAVRTIFASFVATAFLISGILVAISARSYQKSGHPMPNGKRGFMEFHDGYLIAAALLALSFVWFVAARKFRRAGIVSHQRR